MLVILINVFLDVQKLLHLVSILHFNVISGANLQFSQLKVFTKFKHGERARIFITPGSKSPHTNESPHTNVPNNHPGFTQQFSNPTFKNQSLRSNRIAMQQSMNRADWYKTYHTYRNDQLKYRNSVSEMHRKVHPVIM